MTGTGKIKKVKDYNTERELAKVELVFRSIENDKSLPSFIDFFMECLMSGTAENVNLKVMYPKVYKKLNILLKEHTVRILAMRK